MIEAQGTFENGKLLVATSPRPTVINLRGAVGGLDERARYKILGNLSAIRGSDGACDFSVDVTGASLARGVREYAEFEGKVRVNEFVARDQDVDGRFVSLYRVSVLPFMFASIDPWNNGDGWVTVTIPKRCNADYRYGRGDFLYLKGTLYHKDRGSDASIRYELGVRAIVCHKIDATELVECIRACRFEAGRQNEAKAAV